MLQQPFSSSLELPVFPSPRRTSRDDLVATSGGQPSQPDYMSFLWHLAQWTLPSHNVLFSSPLGFPRLALMGGSCWPSPCRGSGTEALLFPHPHGGGAGGAQPVSGCSQIHSPALPSAFHLNAWKAGQLNTPPNDSYLPPSAPLSPASAQAQIP